MLVSQRQEHLGLLTIIWKHTPFLDDICACIYHHGTGADEDYLWRLRLLGEHSPQVLIDTIIYMTGLYFALRSEKEHPRLRHTPSQLQVMELPVGRAYISYREDVSKTNQGGLNSRRKKPKKSSTTPTLPTPNGASFACSAPKGHVWYSKDALGHNTLQETIPRLMKSANFTGYYTNHSLRASAATPCLLLMRSG